jgi:general secretion pathway protein G
MNRTLKSRQDLRGFTIVELLIVIVIIGILAAITIVAFNGTQQRGRDAQRKSDVAAITKALELYYIDKGEYPAGSGSTTINNSWSTTADASWATLQTKLQPYYAKLPVDPVSTPGVNVQTSGYNYAYFSNSGAGTTYCGSSTLQMYILVYRLEGSAQQANTLTGDCTTMPLFYSGVSNYRVAR